MDETYESNDETYTRNNHGYSSGEGSFEEVCLQFRLKNSKGGGESDVERESIVFSGSKPGKCLAAI